MAGTPQAEQTSDQTAGSLPSPALYMSWDTALCRIKALFVAIYDLADSGRVDKDEMITELAALGESITQDQLNYQRQQGE